MRYQCITCGKESNNRKDFFQIAGRVGSTDLCKDCAKELGINNFMSAGFKNNTRVLKKYVKIHPEAQHRLDIQLKLIQREREDFLAEFNEKTNIWVVKKSLKRNMSVLFVGILGMLMVLMWLKTFIMRQQALNIH